MLRINLYSLPRAAITDYHKCGGLKQQTVILTVLEVRSQTARCWQAHAPPAGPGWSSRWLQGNPWCSGPGPHHSNHCLRLHMVFRLLPLCVSCRKLDIDLGPTCTIRMSPSQDPSLNYIGNDPFPNKLTFKGSRDEDADIPLGGTIQPTIVTNERT